MRTPRVPGRWVRVVDFAYLGVALGVFALGLVSMQMSPESPPPAPANTAPEPVADASSDTVRRDESGGESSRELDPNELVRVSHILIAHNQTTSDLPVSAFAQPLGPSSHSPDEALEIARSVAARAEASPDRFAALAREWSEHFPSAPRGGSLGTLRAIELPREFRTVLAGLEPGAVSSVVQTPLGYHVLQRHELPEDQVVAGRQIVIAHSDSKEFLLRPGHTNGRSREAALQMATRVAELARTDPGEFDALVEEYSDSADAARGGDFGAWRVHEAWQNAVELEVLTGLEVGQASEPVETLWGFKVLLRTDEVERPEYAMRAKIFPYETDGPDAPSSLDAARRRAETALTAAQRDPVAFDRETDARVADFRFTQGREIVGVLPALESVPVGSIAPEVLEIHNAFAVVRRLDPGAPRPPEPRELRVEPPRDLKRLFANLPKQGLARALRDFAPFCATRLDLEPAESERLAKLLGSVANALEADLIEGVAAYERLEEGVEELLGTDRTTRVLELARSWATAAITPRS